MVQGLQGKVQKLRQLLYLKVGMGAVFSLRCYGSVVLQSFLSAWASPTLRTFAAFLVAVVLTVILPITNEALVNAEAVLAVVAGSGAKQRVCCCEGKTEPGHQGGQQIPTGHPQKVLQPGVCPAQEAVSSSPTMADSEPVLEH